MSKGKFEELTQYLTKAEDMANSENKDLHVEHAFQRLDATDPREDCCLGSKALLEFSCCCLSAQFLFFVT